MKWYHGYQKRNTIGVLDKSRSFNTANWYRMKELKKKIKNKPQNKPKKPLYSKAKQEWYRNRFNMALGKV